MTTGGLEVENVGRPEPLILDSSATLAWIYGDEITEAKLPMTHFPMGAPTIFAARPASARQ
jgi:hypothetical protein